MKPLSCHGNGRSPCSEVANVLDCNIVWSEFELQSHYNVHLQMNIEPFSPSAFGSPSIKVANFTFTYI